MKNYNLAIGCKTNIDFDVIHPCFNSVGNSSEGVLQVAPPAAAMGR
jgi:hypothetical protein